MHRFLACNYGAYSDRKRRFGVSREADRLNGGTYAKQKLPDYYGSIELIEELKAGMSIVHFVGAKRDEDERPSESVEDLHRSWHQPEG
jgi:hypothetical protein